MGARRFGYEQVDVLGYSFGGGAAFRLAVQHPALVRRLALVSAGYARDSDMYRPEHIVSFYQLLGGGLRDAGWMRENMSQNRLAILPDLTHYEIFFAPAMVATVLPFLNGEGGSSSWAEQIGRRP
jgi:pimeloyl-ACP methyl ester carboxylesterase